MEIDESTLARTGGRTVLAGALRDSRARTLALLEAYAAVLGEALAVPCSAQLNPPLWEAGHVAWFQDYWLARNRQRGRGIRCEPDHERPAGRLPGADRLYDSSRVAHNVRWGLPLPSLAQTLDYLAASLEDSLALLETADENDAGLYFHRLALFHEDMHAEAAVYMAQALDIPLAADVLRPPGQPAEGPPLELAGQAWRLGWSGAGFAFDNELQAHGIVVEPYQIDSAPVSWGRYLPFLESTGTPPPRYLRRHEDAWQCRVSGQWRALDPRAPATHLRWDEAAAWCRWAGRRLPEEAEWELAACTRPEFRWGEVWEWTASRFLPYPGFEAHPYRDYSVPWFAERYVLRGASRATAARMVHPRYRNYFTPERNDIHAGFRSCAA